MSNISLTPELAQLTRDLAAAVASSQKVIAAKARIGLFYQNADATDLFRKVNEYGEKLRNKSMEGMPPSEEEIAKFDSLRQAVVDNDLCKGFWILVRNWMRCCPSSTSILCLLLTKGGSV